MATKKEHENITGLDLATDRKEAEYDLLAALFAAADYKTADENITEVEIKRDGKYYFTVHVHPISDEDAITARKKATTYRDNPQGKKYPKVEAGFNNATFKSWLIYLATTEEDQKTIWGNSAFLAKFNLLQPWESIDKMLTMGEKSKLIDIVTEISGLDEEDEEMDEETFQS